MVSSPKGSTSSASAPRERRASPSVIPAHFDRSRADAVRGRRGIDGRGGAEPRRGRSALAPCRATWRRRRTRGARRPSARARRDPGCWRRREGGPGPVPRSGRPPRRVGGGVARGVSGPSSVQRGGDHFDAAVGLCLAHAFLGEAGPVPGVELRRRERVEPPVVVGAHEVQRAAVQPGDDEGTVSQRVVDVSCGEARGSGAHAESEPPRVLRLDRKETVHHVSTSCAGGPASNCDVSRGRDQVVSDRDCRPLRRIVAPVRARARTSCRRATARTRPWSIPFGHQELVPLERRDGVHRVGCRATSRSACSASFSASSTRDARRPEVPPRLGVGEELREIGSERAALRISATQPGPALARSCGCGWRSPRAVEPDRAPP